FFLCGCAWTWILLVGTFMIIQLEIWHWMVVSIGAVFGFGLAWIICNPLRPHGEFGFFAYRFFNRLKLRYWLPVIFIASIGILYFGVEYIFQGHPLVTDSQSQIAQAQLLAS